MKQLIKFRAWCFIVSCIRLYEGIIGIVTLGFYRPMPSIWFALKYWGFKEIHEEIQSALEAARKTPEYEQGGRELAEQEDMEYIMPTHHNTCPRGEQCACYLTGYTDAEYNHGLALSSMADQVLSGSITKWSRKCEQRLDGWRICGKPATHGKWCKEHGEMKGIKSEQNQ